MGDWAAFESTLRHEMNAHLDSQPESLLEQDGGPVGRTADIILARLVGFDDQIVDDTLRLRRVEPEWRMPIRERLVLAAPEADLYPTMRTATYVLQSGYAGLRLDPVAVPTPPDVQAGPPDFLVSVLFVRYRRRT